MPQPLSAEAAVRRAVNRNPARMAKVARGQRSRKPARFQALTLSELLATRRDPRDVLLEIAETETSALADKLKCSMLEALSERRLAAGLVLPYVSQRLPTQIDVKNTRAIVLNIVDEQRYQELVEVAAEPDDNDGSFSMQLLPTAQPADVQNEEQSEETPAAQSAVTERTEPEKPVSPSVERLAPETAWWDQLSGARRQLIDDVPAAAPTREQWERTDHGTWAPPRKGG